ncbi:MAG TPA: permease prefix domain 1-containing protein [Jatrophihabitans sp.]|nr:permease prefix domain 1-containing protein [Jatrophihabitans sp.]
MSETPIEDVLDDLLRQTRADPRTTRRLLDEAGDHLHATAAELQASGMSRHEAEIEAVRRFGPVSPIAHAMLRRSFLALVFETLRAAIFLAGCGLVAVGISGLVALVMNVLAGRSFVGGGTVFRGPGGSVQEVADDAVVLRVIAGLVGLLALLCYLFWRRRASTPALLPAGLVDALGAAAFAAGTAGLAIASADQAAQTGTDGVGFPLSGALVALPATVYFCARAARALLRSSTHPYQSIGTTQAAS